MKRSQVLRVIETKANQILEDLGSYDRFDKEDAEKILEAVEQAGMLPPSQYRNVSGWDLAKGVPMYVNEWEEE